MASADIWMPLYIGDYLAATTHLSAAESGGYLHLLMHQWKNGRLPASEEALRRIARIDADAWSNAWAMLHPFFDHAQGFPVQQKLETIRAEWLAKKDSASQKASKAALARWSNAPSITPSNAQAMPQSCPSSSSSSIKQKQKPFAATAVAVTAERGKVIGSLPVTGGRFYELREDDLARDGPLFPGVDVMQEYRNMRGWLLASPQRQKTPAGIRRFMNSWLSREQDKARPLGGNHGAFKGKTEHSLDAAARAVQEIEDSAASERLWSAETGEAGHGGLPGVRGGSGIVLAGRH